MDEVERVKVEEVRAHLHGSEHLTNNTQIEQSVMQGVTPE